MATTVSATQISDRMDDERRLLNVYSKLSAKQISNWINSNPQLGDPFSQREPTHQDKLRMASEFIRLGGTANSPRSMTTNRINSAGPVESANQHSIRMQQQMNTMGQTRRRLSEGDMNEEIREYLIRNHPEEETCLRKFANAHNLSPLDAILRCIVFARDALPRESTALDEINQELRQLEKEKHE